MAEIEPEGTYRPQYRLRSRGLVRLLDHFPTLKRAGAELVRRGLSRVFEPGMVTTERVVEYPFVFEVLGGIKGRVLDVGCCHSRLPIALASRGLRVVGIDFNPYPFGHPNLRTVRGDVMRIPFAASTFDAVLAISVIEHIGLGHYADPAAPRGDHAAVAEIARVLRPGGRAVITVPFGRPITDDWKRVYDGAQLSDLLAPLSLRRIEFAVSRGGVWVPATDHDAATVDWNGPDRAVVMAVGTRTDGSV